MIKVQLLFLQWGRSNISLQEGCMQWLTVNLTGHCSVYFKVMCFGAVIHIILGQTNESALFKGTDIFNYSVITSASSTSGHRMKVLLFLLIFIFGSSSLQIKLLLNNN